MKKLVTVLVAAGGAFLLFSACNTSPHPFDENAAMAELGPQANTMSEPERQAYLSRKRREHEQTNSVVGAAAYRPHSMSKRERMRDVSTPTLIYEEREREAEKTGGVFSFLNRNW